MESKRDIVSKINKEINNVIENAYGVLQNLKVKKIEISNEFKDLVVVKKKVVDVADSILKIYSLFVKMKYIKHQEERNVECVGKGHEEPGNIGGKFVELMKSLECYEVYKHE